MHLVCHSLSRYLDVFVFFIKTLMNVDQIYSCLLKLKLDFCLEPNSNYKQTHFLWLQK